MCFSVSVVNGLPFIGFGFLDNFIMILCVSFNYPSSRTRWSTNPHLLFLFQGEWIEQTLNGYMCLSTMAAAGLGNTISDVFGIQSASYVERFTEHLGFRAPPLTQFQFSMKSSRRAANLVSVADGFNGESCAFSEWQVCCWMRLFAAIRGCKVILFTVYILYGWSEEQSVGASCS